MIGETAFKELFPRKNEIPVEIEYSKRFKSYNANVLYDYKKIKFSFSDSWKNVSEKIQIGLAQHLLLKVFKSKKRTLNIELYEKFMEEITKYAVSEVQEVAPDLEESFNRINSEYFNDFMEIPGVEWGRFSTTQLGVYSYQTDTIRISRIFENLEEKWYLDYVMYHELLHKKFGLKHGKQGNCRHHPPEFKKMERKFKVKDAEKLLNSFVNNARPRIKKKVKKQNLLGVMRNIFK